MLAKQSVRSGEQHTPPIKPGSPQTAGRNCNITNIEIIFCRQRFDIRQLLQSQNELTLHKNRKYVRTVTGACKA
jgi:hypothetical protein